MSIRRSDPLDAPLVDDYLLSSLLLPRLASAIRLAFPGAYADWTHDDGGDDDGYGGYGYGYGSGGGGGYLWKRFALAILRGAMIAGSYSFPRSSYDGSVSVSTPAMRASGIRLRPLSPASSTIKSSRERENIRPRMSSRRQYYAKLAFLAVVSALMPLIHEELRRRRERELERGERERLYREFRRVARGRDDGEDDDDVDRGASSPSNSSGPGREAHLRLVVESRARGRRNRLTDFVLGFCEIVIPPLRLANYLAFLWGVSKTPSLAMRIAGWEYDVGDGVFGGSHRHANFQYAHRRLMMEEALRTSAALAILPAFSRGSPLGSGSGGGGGGQNAASTPTGSGQRAASPIASGGGEDDVDAAVGGGGILGPGTGGESPASSSSRLPGGGTLHGTFWNKWSRGPRLLSFLGIGAGTDDRTAVDESTSSETADRSMTATKHCAICRTENPVVPYTTRPCGHAHCYVCLRSAATDDPGYHCAECGRTVVSSRPV